MFFAYSLRNLWVRRASTASAAVGIATVVFMLAAIQMFVAGVQKAMTSSAGQQDRAIILARGAQVEFASALGDQEAAIVRSAPGIAAGVDDALLVAPEVVSVVLVPTRDGRSLNVQVRGTTATSWKIRPEVHISEGRVPVPGTDELVIGKALAGRFDSARIGGQIELRAGHPATIVGIFDAGGSAANSEIWGDFALLRGQLGREGVVSSIRARLTSPDSFSVLRTALVGDPRLSLEVTREADFNEQAASGSTKLVVALGVLVGLFGSIAAIFGAIVALNGSIAQRHREIGTLRALGFSRARILCCLLVEALATALAGGLIGAAAALALGRLQMTTTSFSSFAMTVIRFDAGVRTIGTALAVSCAVGVLGGMLPAIAAASISPTAALRRT